MKEKKELVKQDDDNLLVMEGALWTGSYNFDFSASEKIGNKNWR